MKSLLMYGIFSQARLPAELMQKAGQYYLLAGFSIFGDPFGSPIPQRPQPLDLLLRVGKIVHKKS